MRILGSSMVTAGIGFLVLLSPALAGTSDKASSEAPPAQLNRGDTPVAPERAASAQAPGERESSPPPFATSDKPHEDVSTLPYKYVGNSWSLKFHRPSCPFARVMRPQRAELFHFRREAVEKGESPCRYCLPQEWTRVRARFLPPAS